MIKRFMPALALGALCAVLAGCAFTADDLSTGVTESTDPVALRGEKVEAKDWDNALSETKNFSVKSTVSFPEGIFGDLGLLRLCAVERGQIFGQFHLRFPVVEIQLCDHDFFPRRSVSGSGLFGGRPAVFGLLLPALRGGSPGD